MDDLVTARLVLHPMSVDEAEQVVAGDPDDATRWAPGYLDVSGARGFLDAAAKSGDPRPFGNYQIRRREDGYPIGGIGFFGPANEHGSVTIGYGLAPSARGKGYASEALRELLLFARARGVTGVEADTSHDNIASQRVMTAVGMQLIAEDEQLKYYRITWADGEPTADPGEG
ncbi:MAG: GNAT family N-acetyltransferase [Catenulispora sp.]|nr:GNAT family N-acetyltransferase [Catenulispora sp.]